jgi:hypothetical protein
MERADILDLLAALPIRVTSFLGTDAAEFPD